MAILQRALTRHQRIKTRELARDAWIKSGGDIKKAKQIAKRDMKEALGNPLTMLIIASVVLQICYTLWKWWRDARVSIPPEYPMPGEPYQLGIAA